MMSQQNRKSFDGVYDWKQWAGVSPPPLASGLPEENVAVCDHRARRKTKEQQVSWVTCLQNSGGSSVCCVCHAALYRIHESQEAKRKECCVMQVHVRIVAEHREKKGYIYLMPVYMWPERRWIINVVVRKEGFIHCFSSGSERWRIFTGFGNKVRAPSPSSSLQEVPDWHHASQSYRFLLLTV